jgi:hypothetical protein
VRRVLYFIFEENSTGGKPGVSWFTALSLQMREAEGPRENQSWPAVGLSVHFVKWEGTPEGAGTHL